MEKGSPSNCKQPHSEHLLKNCHIAATKGGSICLSLHVSTCLSVHLSIHPSTHPSIYLTISLSVCLSTRLSIHSSIQPSLCLDCLTSISRLNISQQSCTWQPPPSTTTPSLGMTSRHYSLPCGRIFTQVVARAKNCAEWSPNTGPASPYHPVGFT